MNNANNPKKLKNDSTRQLKPQAEKTVSAGDEARITSDAGRISNTAGSHLNETEAGSVLQNVVKKLKGMTDNIEGIFNVNRENVFSLLSEKEN